MEAIDIEKLNQLISRTDISGNDKVRWLTDFIDGREFALQLRSIDTKSVKRVEVIQYSPPHNGRAYTNHNAKDVEIQIQDKGKTLKIFLK